MVTPEIRLTSNREERPAEVSYDGEERGEEPDESPPSVDPDRAAALIAAAGQAMDDGDLVTARTHYSEALDLGVDETRATLLRSELAKLAAETVFSSHVYDNDPLVGRYTIQPGDTLGKIAKIYKISDDLLARINNIKNKNLIRAGWRIKVIQGPFHGVVDKDKYRMSVYLGSTFLMQYRVGLGEDDSTPTGKWKISTKLVDPTYYPPRGGGFSRPMILRTRSARAGSGCTAWKARLWDSCGTVSTEPTSRRASVRTRRSVACACSTKTWNSFTTC